jgi:CubicO group peptidase (beta-lactamase class C family)
MGADAASGSASDLAAEVEALFARPAGEGVSLAFVVLRHGRVVVERYGIRAPNPFQADPAPVTPETPLISWSIAKSMVHAALGILVGDGRIDPADPAPVPEWVGTEKESITLLDLLEMRSGLRFVEDYVDGEASDVIDMLFGAGATDHAAYAADLPLLHPPGAFWSYASGTTNIVCRIIGDLVAGAPGGLPAARESAMRTFLEQRLFAPAGMPDADPRFDEVGTWAGSSYVYAPAVQFARFGELYLHDGVVGDDRVLPEGWVDQARTVVATDPETGNDYGRHWWVWPDQPRSLAAHGYEGQYVLVLPEHDAVVVHLGKTDASVRDGLVARLRSIVGLL